MTEYLIPAVMFLSLLGAIFGIGWYVATEKRLRAITLKIEKETAAEPSGDLTFVDRVRRAVLKTADMVGRFAKPKREQDISNLKKRFFQAGLSRQARRMTMVFYGAKILLTCSLSLIFLVLKVLFLPSLPPLNAAILFLALALLGFYLPDIWLAARTAGRKELILRGFPDAIDLMVICAEAGMGIEAAIARVGEETRQAYPALSDELRLFMLEVRAGKSRRDALKALAMRTGLLDVESFATLLIQTEQFGTSIAKALRVQADTMRVKRSQRVEELAAKLPVKLLFPTILFIFPSLFLVLMGPAIIMAFRMWSK